MMQMLVDRIKKDGVIKHGNVLKVDSFLNHHKDSNRIPISRITSPPAWEPFSITMPIPSTLAPAHVTSSISPTSAQPFAKKLVVRTAKKSGCFGK